MPDNFHIKDNQITLAVNPKLYPLEAVYSAAYVFMDRAYIVLDGDPKKEILVRMKIKEEFKSMSLGELGNEFNNELLNYADYLTRAKETKKIREMFLQRAIITNDPETAEEIIAEGGEDLGGAEDVDLDELDEEDFLDDPEGIAIPWEEKYGKKDEGLPEEKNEDKTKQ
jgi:His-Xaa-Ser system protein HxsD